MIWETIDKTKGEIVPVHFRPGLGEERKRATRPSFPFEYHKKTKNPANGGGEYVAVIEGPDPKYGLRRTFLTKPAGNYIKFISSIPPRCILELKFRHASYIYRKMDDVYYILGSKAFGRAWTWYTSNSIANNS